MAAAGADVEEQRPLMDDPKDSMEEETMVEEAERIKKHLRTVLWEEFRDQKEPKFFDNIAIAEDGGLTHVVPEFRDDPTFWVRYITAATTVWFAFFNTVSIIRNDVKICLSTVTTHRGPVVIPKLFNGVVNYGLRLIGYQENFFFPGVKLLAICELAVLLILVGNCFYRVWMMYFDKKEYRQWLGAAILAWDLIPALSVFSAFGLLYYVTPVVLSMHITQKIQDLLDDDNESGLANSIPVTICKVLLFVFSRLLAGIVGFDAFEFKFWMVAEDMLSVNLTFWEFMNIAMFLVQVMGIVKLSIFIRERILVFIFAGEDGVLEHSEMASLDVFNALLVRKIMTCYSKIQGITLMLSFSDIDFQRMVLNEKTCGRACHGYKVRKDLPPRQVGSDKTQNVHANYYGTDAGQPGAEPKKASPRLPMSMSRGTRLG